MLFNIIFNGYILATQSGCPGYCRRVIVPCTLTMRKTSDKYAHRCLGEPDARTATPRAAKPRFARSLVSPQGVRNEELDSP